MRLAVTYTHCATYSKEQTGDIITFTQFEEDNLSSETYDYAENGDKSNANLIMPPLFIKEEMDVMDSRYEYEY